MLANRYLSLLNRAVRENALLKLALVCLTVIAFLQYLQASDCREQATTVLLPPGANEAMEVSATGADEAYLRQMSRYVAGLALTFTPSTARNQFSELLALYDSEAYAEAGDTIKLTGRLLKTINRETQTPQPAEYRLRYAVEGGRFRIKELWKHDTN